MGVYYTNKNTITKILTILKKINNIKDLFLPLLKISFFCYLFIYILSLNVFSNTQNKNNKNILSSIDDFKIAEIYDSYVDNINLNQNYLSYFYSKKEWNNKIAFVDDFSNHKLVKKNNDNERSISFVFNFNPILKKYFYRLDDISNKAPHGLKVFLSFLKNFNDNTFFVKNDHNIKDNVYFNSDFNILNLFQNKNIKFIDGKTFKINKKNNDDLKHIDFIDDVYSSQWFIDNQDIKIWNNSFVLGQDFKNNPNLNLDYLNKMNNLKTKIQQNDNVFVFSIGNFHKLIHSDVYKLNQKVKSNINSINKKIKNHNFSLLEKNIKEKTNIFYQLFKEHYEFDFKVEHNLNHEQHGYLTKQDKGKNFNTIFVAGFDKKYHNIWGDNQSLNKKDLDFSGYCLETYHYCVLADVELNKKEKGTSFSAPQVSFYFVLLKEIYPFLTNNQIGELILKSAKNIDPKLPVPNKIYGYGLIDLNKALKLPFYSSEIEEKDKKIRIFYSKNEDNDKNKIVTFSNLMKGEIILDDLNEINKQVIVNFNSLNKKNIQNIHDAKIKIGNNNIVIVQNKNIHIENNGILIVDKKFDLKFIKNLKDGKVIQIDLNKTTLFELKKMILDF